MILSVYRVFQNASEFQDSSVEQISNKMKQSKIGGVVPMIVVFPDFML